MKNALSNNGPSLIRVPTRRSSQRQRSADEAIQSSLFSHFFQLGMSAGYRPTAACALLRFADQACLRSRRRHYWSIDVWIAQSPPTPKQPCHHARIVAHTLGLCQLSLAHFPPSASAVVCWRGKAGRLCRHSHTYSSTHRMTPGCLE